MKFDCIVMNPPYQRNLHLKILAEAIKHLKDDGTCVNLSPMGWLKEKMFWRKNTTYAFFAKKFRNKFDAVEFINRDIATALFGIAVDKDLGIAIVKKDNGKYDIDQFVNATKKADFLFSKVLAKLKRFNGPMKSISDALVSNKTCTGFYATMPLVFGLPGQPYTASKDFATFAREKTITAEVESHGFGNMKVVFKTEQELRNFHKSLFTSFVGYIILTYKTSLNAYTLYPYIPWFGDATNPRTGLKGYEGEWTDEDLMLFFNITPEEQKVIEDTMEKYDPK